MVELLSEQRASTRENVQRKQARTGDAGDDSEEEEIGEEESDDDEEDIPYNPKNLPLGLLLVSFFVNLFMRYMRSIMEKWLNEIMSVNIQCWTQTVTLCYFR